MTMKDKYGLHSAVFAIGASLLCLSLVTACGDSSEERMAADIDCAQIAASRSGYKPAGSDSSVGKGAAIGAAGSAVVGAVSSKKSQEKGQTGPESL